MSLIKQALAGKSDTSHLQDAQHGGTGETSLRDSANALLGSLAVGDMSAIDDDMAFITQYYDASQDTYRRRPASLVWTWIKGKASAVFPLLVGGTSLSSTDDLDYILDVGTYYVSGSSNTPVNAPTSGFVGKIIVDIPHGVSNSSIRGQRAVSYVSGRSWYRRYESNTWYPWYAEAYRTQTTSTANQFLATPDGAAGYSSYRSIAIGDIPNLPTSKISDLGKRVSKDISTAVSVANASSATSGTGTAIDSVTLGVGTWLIYGHWVFANNSTGNRWGAISNTSGTVTPSATTPGSFRVAACASAPTVMNAMHVVTLGSSDSKIYYLNAAQNSGGSLNVTGCIRAIQIA